MRLKFDAQDWKHVLMAVRIAQKVLTSGEHKTSSWETQRGRHILDELSLLIKTGPNPAPQVATKIDLSHLGGMMPDKHAPLVASSSSTTKQCHELCAYCQSWVAVPGTKSRPFLQVKLDDGYHVFCNTDCQDKFLEGRKQGRSGRRADELKVATDKRLDDMETRIIDLMTRPAPAAAPAEGASVPAGLEGRLTQIGDQNVRIFEFLATLEDRLLALERKRK